MNISTMKTLLICFVLSGCSHLGIDRESSSSYFYFRDKGCEVAGILSDNTSSEVANESVSISRDCVVTIENIEIPDEVIIKENEDQEE